ncbi:MAG: hypothetical protein NTW49_11810 [Bacteroidia bacterium]|nr:hypothetical protein [Bacteroidia bacterium]
MKLSEQEIDSILNDDGIYRGVDASPGFYDQMMARIEQEMISGKHKDKILGLQGKNFRIIILILVCILNISSFLYFGHVQSTGKSSESAYLLTLAEASAVDQSNLNLLTLNSK